MVRILSSISNQQPSSNMDDSGFFSIQVSMKRSFIGLMGVVVGGGGVNIHLIQQWQVQGRGMGGPGSLLIFWSNWGPKGRKKFFGDQPPLSQGLEPALFSGLVGIFQTINDWY